MIVKLKKAINGKYEFNEFLEDYIAKNSLKIIYYLQKEEILKNKGEFEIKVIDTSNYLSNDYQRKTLRVNKLYENRVKSNILYVRTVDTGSYDGRTGLSIIREDFDVDGIFVSGNTYRTSPIQLFLEPEISKTDQLLVKEYFNFVLEYFRKKLDSEFLTTYKYSNADYTRKYLGLTQVRKIIETMPILDLSTENKIQIKRLIKNQEFEELQTVLNQFRGLPSEITKDITSWL